MILRKESGLTSIWRIRLFQAFLVLVLLVFSASARWGPFAKSIERSDLLRGIGVWKETEAAVVLNGESGPIAQMQLQQLYKFPGTTLKLDLENRLPYSTNVKLTSEMTMQECENGQVVVYANNRVVAKSYFKNYIVLDASVRVSAKSTIHTHWVITGCVGEQSINSVVLKSLSTET